MTKRAGFGVMKCSFFICPDVMSSSLFPCLISGLLSWSSSQTQRTWLTGLCRRLAQGNRANVAPVCRFRSYSSKPWRRGIEVSSQTINTSLPPYPSRTPCPAPSPSCCASCLWNLAAYTAVWSFCWLWDCLSFCWWTPTTYLPPSRRMSSLTDASSISTSVPPALVPAGAANSWMARFPLRHGVAYDS